MRVLNLFVGKRGIRFLVSGFYLGEFDNERDCILKFGKVAGSSRHLMWPLGSWGCVIIWGSLLNTLWSTGVESEQSTNQGEKRMEGNNRRYGLILPQRNIRIMY